MQDLSCYFLPFVLTIFSPHFQLFWHIKKTKSICERMKRASLWTGSKRHSSPPSLSPSPSFLISLPLSADHWRADRLGYWDEFAQKACFKKLVCLHHIRQNNLTYLGQVCTPCLSVSTGIYALSIHPFLSISLPLFLSIHSSLPHSFFFLRTKTKLTDCKRSIKTSDPQ